LIHIYITGRKDKRAKAGNPPKISALSEFGEHWIVKNFSLTKYGDFISQLYFLTKERYRLLR